MPDQMTTARKAAIDICEEYIMNTCPRNNGGNSVWPCVCGYEKDCDTIQAVSAIIERHVAPHIAEKDKRIAELEKIIRDGNELHDRISKLEAGGNRQ